MVDKKVLKYFKDFSEKRDDLSWVEIRDKFVEDFGFDEDEVILLILKVITDKDSPLHDDPLNVFYFDVWYAAFGSDMFDIFKEHGAEIIIDFSDTFRTKDGKVYLKTDGWCDFQKFFKYGDDTYMFEKMFCKEDFWEVYDYGSTFSESWNNLDNKCIGYIKEYLIKKFLNELVTPEDYDELEEYLDPVPEGEENSDRTITLTPEKIQSVSDGELKVLIESTPELEDLKYEITWSLSSALNTVAYDDIHGKLLNQIEDVFGKGKWKSGEVKRNGEKKIIETLEFDITDIFDEYVNNYVSNKGENPSDEFTYFIDLAKEVLDDSEDLFSSGINYDYYHPDVSYSDMYEELRNRF